MGNVKLKFVIEDTVVLIKAHIVQENEDGTEKYIQSTNIELSFEDFLKYQNNKKEEL